MYTITHNGATLYDPRLQGYPVDKLKLTREVNVFDTLTFTLYPQHPAYGHLDKKSSILNLYRDGELLCQFVPTYHRRIFNGGIEYKCKSIICFLDDFYFRTLEYNGTASGMISSVLSAYNSRVGEAYKITMGTIHAATVEYKTSDPKTLWEALQDISTDCGGYIAPRFENGRIYLDYLQDSDLPLCDQKIQFGENMTDLFIETDTDNCFSVLYPFGTNEDNEVVSIAEVNGGKDYLENATAVESYGRREKMITWANVESQADLLARARAKLSAIAALFYEGVQLSAVDLHNLDVNIPALAFLHLIDCVAVPHGYTHRYPITKISLPLDAPDSEDITLGMAPKSLTDRFTLERKKNAQSRSGGGRSIAKAQKDIIQHWQHVTQVTDRGMSDCFGIVGVSIDPETGLPKVDETTGEYIWMEDDPDASATYGEIWGHLHRDAWTTEILHNVSDSNGNVLSMAQVNVDGHGDILINAINNQGTGTAQINANRIHIQSTSGSGIQIDQNGNIRINAAEAVDAINSSGSSVVISAAHVDIDGWLKANLATVDGLYSKKGITALEWITAGQYVNAGTDVQISGNSLKTAIVGFGTATESGGAISIPSTTFGGTAGPSINFNIAATQFYQDGVAARTAHSISRIDLTETDIGETTQPVTVLSTDNWEEALTVTVDASAVYDAGVESVTLSQAPPVNGVVRVSATNGEYEDVVFRTADEVSKITLLSSDTGADISKTVTVGYDNGDTTTNVPVSVDASAVYAAGQDSVNVVMGSWSGGSVTFSPSVGAGTGKTLELSNISGPNTITANGEYTYTVMYEDANGNDQSTGLTKKITVDTPVSSIQTRRYVTYTSNGTRTVSPSSGYDAMAAVEVTVNVPPPAYSASGWGITSTAGGGTKVELYVDGNHFSHTFDNYP